MRSICLLTLLAALASGHRVTAFATVPPPRTLAVRSVVANQTNPTIAQAFVAGKQLIVIGLGFQSGATVLLDGKPIGTDNDPTNPTTMLVARKGGKKVVNRGWMVTLQVQNPDGMVSDAFTPIKMVTIT